MGTEPGPCFHGDQPPCKECADEERQFRYLRSRAGSIAPKADEIEHLLSSLEVALNEVISDHNYQEFYRLTMDDIDAVAFLAGARRAVRSFARIARERAMRTERNP